MKPAECLSYYATRFDTVEVDSTFYGTPAIATVQKWYAKTPAGFVFAAKVPQVITHEKLLVDCHAELGEFLTAMDALREKLGPLLLQFGYFNTAKFKRGKEFLARLRPFLKRLPAGYKFAVEIRNKAWLDACFLDVLREHGVALAVIDQSWMPRPWEMDETLDLITADFAYVRWLGDRKEIEELTKSWDKTIVDRRPEMERWVKLIREYWKRDLKIFAYANNHYAGNGPGTVKLFWDTWGKKTMDPATNAPPGGQARLFDLD